MSFLRQPLMPAKLLTWGDDTWSAWERPHLYQREPTTAGERLVIAPREDATGLLLELSQVLPEPFPLLYVLLVSRCDHAPGRYQAPTCYSRAELRALLSEIGPYLERDGRHHLWVAAPSCQATLVYDQHDVLYAYGPLDEYEEILKRRGVAAGVVTFPAPHQHAFNPIFDDDERRMMARVEWSSDLQPEDDPE